MREVDNREDGGRVMVERASWLNRAVRVAVRAVLHAVNGLIATRGREKKSLPSRLASPSDMMAGLSTLLGRL
jgi:hypothetical protein